MRKLRIVPKKEVQQTPCKIEFRDVSFRYPDSKDFVLKAPQRDDQSAGKNRSCRKKRKRKNDVHQIIVQAV